MRLCSISIIVLFFKEININMFSFDDMSCESYRQLSIHINVIVVHQVSSVIVLHFLILEDEIDLSIYCISSGFLRLSLSAKSRAIAAMNA